MQNTKSFFSKIGFSKIKIWSQGNKILSSLIVLAIVLGGYMTYKHFTNTSGETKYVLGKVRVGKIEQTVSGTGYVSAEAQIDIKSKVSGTIKSINTKAGDKVAAGQLLAQIDSRDAGLTLESARIAYEKLTGPAKQSDLDQAKNNISKSYNDAWNAISGTFLDMPSIMSGAKDILYSSNGFLYEQGTHVLGDVVIDYRNKAGVSLDLAEKDYEKVTDEYKSLNRSSSQTEIDNLLSDTLDMTRQTADALKNIRNTVNYINSQYPTYDASIVSSTSSSINTWSSDINSSLSGLVSSQNTLVSDKDALKKLVDGADPLDVRSEAISLQEKENAYADYFIRAPFSGTIAKVGVKVGDESSGATMATIVSDNKIAEIPLNEIDAANVRVGQTVKMTFDAVPNLTLNGIVEEVDLVGTVSQGVVTYNIKVSFDPDERIKSGMSASANIITNSKDDVLVVPTAAVKARGPANRVEHYVEKAPTATSTPPIQIPVEVGIADDTNVEIIGGLEAGDTIVVRTITTTKAPASTAPSLFGGGGGAVRTGTGTGTGVRAGGTAGGR